jgi:hypothetical protein
MMLYEVYADTECPRCGNTRGNRDQGPYEVMFPTAVADHGCPEVHYVTCGGCGKGFDAGPATAAARWQAMFGGYPA